MHILFDCAVCWAKLFQSCRTLCNPMDCSPPGSSVCRILQARIVECHGVAMPSCRRSFNPGIEPMSLMSPALAGGFFTTSATWEALSPSNSPVNSWRKTAVRDDLPISLKTHLFLLHSWLIVPIFEAVKSFSPCIWSMASIFSNVCVTDEENWHQLKSTPRWSAFSSLEYC